MNDALDTLHRNLRGRPREINPAHWDSLAEQGGKLIDIARQSNDVHAANRAWHLTTVATARGSMCRLFIMMREGHFRSAWCELEQVEHMVIAIERNSILADDFSIGMLGEMVNDWQTLYPYQVFASPEMIIRKQDCTICNTVVSPMRSCGHLPGLVYAGKMCSRRIKEFEAVSISLVRDPVQKYSVMIPEPDPHDYARVKFVLDRLTSPFNGWRLVQTSILHDHSYFSGWSSDGNCPCHSGFRYADCCQLKAGVTLPHDQIYFEEPPAEGHSQFMIRRRTHANGEVENVSVPDQVV